jgi:carboxylesterase type B
MRQRAVLDAIKPLAKMRPKRAISRSESELIKQRRESATTTARAYSGALGHREHAHCELFSHRVELT